VCLCVSLNVCLYVCVGVSQCVCVSHCVCVNFCVLLSLSVCVGVSHCVGLRSTSINAEYFPQFNGQEGFYDAFAVGVDIETGGHVFQIHFTNARAMIEKGFVAETVDDFWDGKFRLGFNISRAFDLMPVRK